MLSLNNDAVWLTLGRNVEREMGDEWEQHEEGEEDKTCRLGDGHKIQQQEDIAVNMTTNKQSERIEGRRRGGEGRRKIDMKLSL